MITEAAAKASSEQNENPGVERNPSGTVNQSGDECGNENGKKRVRGRKRAQEGSENVKYGRAKTSRGGVSKAGSGRGKKSKVEAVTLFEVVTMGRSAMQLLRCERGGVRDPGSEKIWVIEGSRPKTMTTLLAVVDDWIEAYESDRETALLDLISFFFQCSGCKGVVTAEMCQNRQDSDVMSKMVESLDEDAGLQYKKFLAFPWILTVTWPMDIDNVEYPLIQPGPYGRWFHIEFCDFVSVLVSQCQHSVIFDNYLMSVLISLLTELSDSCVRAFRHTCTLAAVKLVSSLVGVALSLSVGVENSQKLYNVGKTKTTGRQRTAQLGKIQKKITELQNKRVEIENMMDTIFKGVFLKRYRDVLPDIRSICMEELCVWMKLYSTAFLNDSYLKYIGWMLYDKQPEVRLKCVLGLQGLYRDPVLLSKLDLFSYRFKDRMISMTLDKDNEVAVQTMKLLVLISKTCDEVLSPEDYKQLFQFVYSSHRLLATSAGELLYSRILNTSSPTPEAEDGGNENDTHTRQTTTKLMALLRFYQDSELHKHVVYLVDSLWDCAGALLKDWSTITSIMLQDPTPESTGPPVLTLAEQAVVVEILVSSVRQASEGPVLVGRSGAKKVMSAKEKKTQMDDCSKITEHFLSVLPKMLSKFSHSSDMVAALMKIPHYFLPECPATENTQMVLDLLAKMGAVVDLHTIPGVLEAAARSYQSLCGEEKAWHLMASTARDSLAQSWVDRLATLLEVSLTDGTFSADEEKTGNILATLKKLCAFQNAQDLKLKLFELLTPLLSAESTWGGVPPEILLESLRCLCYSMLWNLNTSGVTLTSREKAMAQRTQLSVFCEKSYRCLTHVNMNVREQAFLGLCDILTAHNYQLHVFEPTSFGPLCYTPNPKLQRSLSTFVLDQVFISPDSNGQNRAGEDSEVEKLEDLHRRRNLLAAYSKLIVHGVLEMSMAAGIYSFYMKHYNDFGDIIKETLYRTRQTDKIQSAHTLVLCLQQLFVRLKQEQQSGGRADPAVQTFTSIKELARRFALTFGDLVKYRESVAMIHTSGIEFVFHGFVQTPDSLSPPYLSYLAILSEFSCKLLKPDKKTVLAYLQKHTGEHILSPKEDCWQPLIYYRASLLAVADAEDASSYVCFDKRPLLRQNLPLDGSKSPSPVSSISKGSKAQKHTVRSRSSVSNPPEKIQKMDQCLVTTEPPATKERSDVTVTSTNEEVDIDTIEIDVDM